jgi:hypothetical protein
VLILLVSFLLFLSHPYSPPLALVALSLMQVFLAGELQAWLDHVSTAEFAGVVASVTAGGVVVGHEDTHRELELESSFSEVCWVDGGSVQC